MYQRVSMIYRYTESVNGLEIYIWKDLESVNGLEIYIWRGIQREERGCVVDGYCYNFIYCYYLVKYIATIGYG